MGTANFLRRRSGESCTLTEEVLRLCDKSEVKSVVGIGAAAASIVGVVVRRDCEVSVMPFGVRFPSPSPSLTRSLSFPLLPRVFAVSASFAFFSSSFSTTFFRYSAPVLKCAPPPIFRCAATSLFAISLSLCPFANCLHMRSSLVPL